MSAPRVEREPVELPLLGGALGEVWDTIGALAHRLDVPWTIVGGQMVLLHGLEHDETPPRVSTDVDAAVDVRADRAAIGRLVFTLTSQLGFESAGVSPEGRAYRFHRRVGSATASLDLMAVERDPVQVDVLAPEGLGERADLRTVGAATAFPTPGVTQALARTELVPVRFRAGVEHVPRPNLLGGIVGKATASIVDHVDQDRHRADLAFLCGLVADPLTMREEITRKDRQRLTSARRAFPDGHLAWAAANVPGDARGALDILITV